MKNPEILCFNPYPLKNMYPVFSALLVELVTNSYIVTIACPELGAEQRAAGIKHHKTWRINRPLIHHLTFLLSSSLFIIRKCLSKGELIIVFLGPLTSLLFFLLLPFRSKIRVLSYQPELHDDRLGKVFPLYKFANENVDLFIDVDATRLDIRQQKFALKFRRVFLFPNFIITPPAALDLISTSRSNINFVYGGGISPEHGIELIFDAFKVAKLNNVLFHVYPIGGIGQQARLSWLKQHFPKAEGFVWHEELPRQDFLMKLEHYDIGVCSYPWIDCRYPLKVNLNSMYAAPTKIFDYLSRGLVILTGEHPNLKFLKEMHLAILFDYNDNRNIENSFRKAIQMLDKESKQTIQARSIENFSLEPYLKDLIRIFGDYSKELMGQE